MENENNTKALQIGTLRDFWGGNELMQILQQIRENIDDLGVNTEIIERSNKLIYDKLDTIETISKKRNQTIEQKALNQYELERNNECYMTLSYVITRELMTIDNTLQDIYDYINKIENIIKEDTKAISKTPSNE